MVIMIKKNHILLTLLVFCVSAMAFNLFYTSNKPVSAIPVANRTIIVDAGHGGEDGGASSKTGTVEKDLNLQVALKLQALLKQSGCAVFTSRADDISIHNPGEEKKGNRKISDLDNRKALPKEYKADAFVSIHMNTFPQTQYYGSQVFYSSFPPESKKLGDIVMNELVQGIDNKNIRVAKEAINNIYILNDTKVPSIVVECGFLSNPDEAARLKTPEYQQKLAFNIYSGILKFFASK